MSKPVRQYNVAILALKDAAATTIVGPQDVFSMTGVLYEMALGQEPCHYFSVTLVTADGRAVSCYNNLQITPHCSMDKCNPDVIVIPGILNVDDTLRCNDKALQWLQEQHDRGCLITAICSGSLLLAETGLLDGKVATTHWAMVNLFRQRYPKVQLTPDELITEEGGLVCSGGFNSFLDVSIYVIEKLCGSTVALQCSKIFVHDPGRRSQAPYSIFTGTRDHGDKRIIQIQETLERDYATDIDFTGMAKEYGMGRRTLERHFKKATGETPLAYLQQVRVERAKHLLELGNSSFDEISFQVGYMDNSFFRKLFKKYTSLRPSDYKAKFA
ncbi:MAG: helix-turn-helix domain-containing protein [Thermodesulfobacteriota bacterium]